MGKTGRLIVKAQKIDVDELIKLLNRALADEWLAYYQYWVGAKIAVGVPRGEVTEELEEHAKEELEHAEELTKRIIELGGQPIIDPKEWFKQTNCGYLVPSNPYVEALIDQNIQGERCAIAVYQKLIDFTKGKDHITCDLALHILKEEVEHEQDLEDLKADLEACKKSK
jgi:bacterioferritin